MDLENGQNADANATSVQDAGISSIADASFQRSDVTVNPVSTVDDDSGKGPSGSATAGEVGDKAGEIGDENGAGGAQSMRFDQHPDWQRMMKERDDARTEAAVAKAKLESIAPPIRQEVSKAAPTLEPSYKDISKMSKEDLLEWFEDDPVGYEANRMAQLKHETMLSIRQERAAASKAATISQTFKKYAEDNPDFTDLWKSGEIKRHMGASPRHLDAISAHKELTEEKRFQAAVAKASKEAEEKVIKNFQAKRNATVLSEGAGSKVKSAPDELKDTKAHGGLVSAITSRLQRLRQASAGG